MKSLVVASILLMAGLVLSVSPTVAADGTGGARVYVVKPGDTLWSIGRRTGTDPMALAVRNHIADPRHVEPGRSLLLDDRPAAAPMPERLSGEAARRLLVSAAKEFELNPSFVTAVSLWESGWNQAQISKDGAVGLMQILPITADWAGPALLGRKVDIYKAADNARLGAALLRRYLDLFSDPRLALAAYYQGEKATRMHGIFPSSRDYVEGVWALRNQLEASTK